MSERILVTGKKISSMELVTNVTGFEKIPTGQPDDLAIAPNQIADYTIARGNLVNRDDLLQVESDLGIQITDLANDVASADDSIRDLIAAEEAARISADSLKVDKEGSVSSVAGRVGDVVLSSSDVLVEGFGSQEDVNKYVPKPFLSGYTYGLGERVVLNDGEVVKSLVEGNVGNPNVDMTGWVSAVSVSLSDTIPTFNTPEAGVDPVTGVADGTYFNVRSSNDESYVDEYQNVGGVPTPSGKSYPSNMAKWDASLVVDGDKNQHQINELQKHANLMQLPVFSVKAFGAKGDGVTDDRAAIQAAIDAAINNGGGTIFFPSTGEDYIDGAGDYSKFYAVKSTHPDYPDSALVVKLQGSQYVRGNLTFMGQGYNSRVELHTTSVIEKMMYFPLSTRQMVFDNLYLESSKKANYGLHMIDSYHPFLTMRDCTFRGSIEASTIIATYVSSFTRCVWSVSKIGVVFYAPSTGPLTSITLNSCYANNNTEVGYDFGYITYCSLNGCASDDCPIAYRFGAAYGVAMNGCGAERSQQPVKVVGYRGFTINAFFGLSCGSTDSGNPSPHLIEFVAGTNAMVSGIQFAGNRHYTHILGVTGSSYGSENVTVLDRSVTRAQASYVSNYAFQRPIKFLRDDQTEVARTYNFTTAEELKSLLNGQYRDFDIDHTITVNLADGTYDLSGYLNLYRVGGRGELIIQGNASDRSLVKLDTGISNLRVTDCSVRVVFKDLTLMSTGSNGLSVRLIAEKSKNVVLDNCVLERGAVNTGTGVSSRQGSRVSIINNTTAVGAFSVGSFIALDTSEILMPAMSEPPSSGTWTVGMKIYNSAPTTHIGWVYSAGAWKTFGAIV